MHSGYCIRPSGNDTSPAEDPLVVNANFNRDNPVDELIVNTIDRTANRVMCNIRFM